MKNKKLTAGDKGMLVNEQRFSMIVVLCNILDSESGVSDGVKSAVAASLLNTIEMSFIPEDDDVFADLIITLLIIFVRVWRKKQVSKIIGLPLLIV